MSTTTTAQVTSDTESKVFKREALRTVDAPRDDVLKGWLSQYLPSEKNQRPPPKITFAERKLRLVAKKARVDALMSLRARALKESARRWPKLREAREADKENEGRAAAARQRAAIAKAEREAAAARVAHLMRLRKRVDSRVIYV
ncbi:hypothetical protein DFH07DRAFT_953163 [Mycena maculata]|uniref:Uncharacterized protein n=1 Tax=Mycena maculata TaxID=230809 RepID=A0AAD7NRN7_9AGAR|nr:hypothetical protein DFH07DRAFT_953163 [Mycena maculata]